MDPEPIDDEPKTQQEPPKPPQPPPHHDDPFLDSKLFNEALSKPTSHYIQSKLLSMPNK